MADSHNILMDCHSIIQSLDRNEIESRIEWLEASLQTYRTVLVLKDLQDRAPIQAPRPKPIQPFHVPLTDKSDEEAGRSQRKHGETKEIIISYMLSKNRLVTVRELIDYSGASSKAIAGCLSYHKLVFRKVKHLGKWPEWQLVSRFDKLGNFIENPDVISHT